jgi:hypothetical protein
MLPGYTAKTIHDRNRRLLTISLVLIALVLLFFAYNWQYFSSFLSGTHDVSSAQLAGFTKLSDAKNIFVRVQVGSTNTTGEVDTTTNDDHETVTQAYYYISDVAGRKLLVRGALALPYSVEGIMPSEPFEGRLRPLNSHTRKIIQDADTQGLSDDPKYLPFYLDTVEYRDFGYWSFALGGLTVLGEPGCSFFT